MSTHIIFIHGRSNKPWITQPPDFRDPDEVRDSGEYLRQLWLRPFLEGLRRIPFPATLSYWNQHQDRIHMAYYGDILNIIERNRSDGICQELEGPVEALIDITASMPERSSKTFLRDLGVDTAAFLAEGLGFKDDLLLKNLRDLKAYVEDQVTASKIRQRLHGHLDALLRDNHRVAIIGHSLGSLIAYDALWKISHRSEFAALADRKIEVMATIGSPLGNRAFLNNFRIDARLDKGSQFPRNIRRWYNFSATGDFVAHDAKLRNDFKKRGFLKHLENGDEHFDSIKLCNPYRNRKGKWNPHKSFGYLINPALARCIERFTVESEGL